MTSRWNGPARRNGQHRFKAWLAPGRLSNVRPFYRPVRRRVIIIAGTLMALAVLTVGGMLHAINRGMNARLGPVHRFPAPAGESFLTDERAVVIAREVMNRDEFPEPAWKLMEDDRSKAPDGRPDRHLMRNTDDPMVGMIYFHCDNSRTPQRFVHLEFRNGEITARGELGK